jgi:hypothetical protein
MKKILIAFFVIATLLALSMYGYGFDLNLKKKGCETACDSTYDECKKSAQEAFKEGKDKAKKAAQEKACGTAKDECYKKCDK